jgi:hypothetical protein
MGTTVSAAHRDQWNKGKIVWRKAPLKVKDIWERRVRLQAQARVCKFALFNLEIDSKLRGRVHVAPRTVCKNPGETCLSAQGS